jgi:capsular polysaccharide biosynthesis protein
MSLLLIVRKLWKYKLFTLPILALVLAGAVYVFAVKAPTYEAGSTYILVNPPPPPTDAQIALDPELGRIDSDNPYLRFSDQTVLVQVLASRLNSEDSRQSLAEQGADPNYTVAPSPEFGFSAPILQITGTGTSAAAAVRTANLVGEAVTKELNRMQEVRRVDKLYRIKAEAVVGAHDATLKASGKLRALVAVFALGTILMFIVVSVLDAISALRAEWAQNPADDEYFVVGAPLESVMDPLSDSDHDPDEVQWPLRAQR